MSALLTLILVLIFLACLGFLYPEGMWSNAIRLINVILAALLAINYFEPLARQLEEVAAELHLLLGFSRDVGGVWGRFRRFPRRDGPALAGESPLPENRRPDRQRRRLPPSLAGCWSPSP